MKFFITKEKDLMKKHKQQIVLVIVQLTCALWVGRGAQACTSMLVTKGASADGSLIVTYTCDAETHGRLKYLQAADHAPGERARNGKVKQVAHTYGMMGYINEHQLVIAETTTIGRKELGNRKGKLQYEDLIKLALQRAKTARGAIKVMADLVLEYGYRGMGESFSIADKEEGWIMELIGPGPGGKGAPWVALKVPDGYVSCFANGSRIGEFPLDDPENCLYSKNVISLAIEKGYYDPQSGKPFRFCDAYLPVDAERRRYTATRVWSVFRRAAPSQEFSSDYHRGKANAQPYPLWIKPDKKLTVPDVCALMRDHFEGTEYDMNTGTAAGPYGCPKRWRPMTFEVDDTQYAWERPISTQQTAFSFVSQSRNWLPDPIGGLMWYGMDDTYTTCYFPLYCAITEVPKSLTKGNLQEFSWDSAWWVFNFVANIANLKYCYMIQDIQKVQKQIESDFFELQPIVEKTALQLYKTNPELMIRYLTNYSVTQGEMVVDRWRRLGEELLCKYNDGYIKDEKGKPQSKGYPQPWLQEVIKTQAKQYRLSPK